MEAIFILNADTISASNKKVLLERERETHTHYIKNLHKSLVGLLGDIKSVFISN